MCMQKKFSAFRYFESRLPDGKNSLPEVPVPAVGVSQELNKMITPTGTVSHGERPQGEFLNEIQNQQKHAASVEASVNAQINNPQTPSTLRTELVQTQNAYQADKQANTQRTKEVLLKNSDVKFEFDNKGNITVDSLRSLFGDLDRRGGVEVTNVGRFRKLFNGGKEQKFIIGEAQLQENLKDFTDVVQLEDVYRRVTGDMGGLNISKSDYYRQEEIKSGQNRGDVVDVEALLPEKLKKVKNFQTALLEKTAMVAGLMGVLFGDADQRAGLNMVLTGNVDKINNLLLSPEGQKKALEYVQKSETLSREPGLGYKIANALLKIGINFPIALMTKGIVSANFENSDLKIVHPETTAGSESEKRQNLVKDSVSNLSLDKQVGENGSIAANLDIVGARFEVNWNDPKSTINSALNKYVQASDKNAAINEIIQALNSKGVSGIREKTKQNNEDQAKILSEQFKQMHAEFILLYTQMQAKNPNDPRLAEMRKALQTEVSSYVGKMMELRGTKLQGAFANFGLG